MEWHFTTRKLHSGACVIMVHKGLDGPIVGRKRISALIDRKDAIHLASVFIKSWMLRSCTERNPT